MKTIQNNNIIVQTGDIIYKLLGLSQAYFQFIIVIFWLVLPKTGLGQCDRSLINKAISNIDSNYIFIREFNVKLEGSNVKRPEPIAKYNIYLQDQIEYHFTVQNSINNKVPAILQLFEKEQLITSNMDFKTREIDSEINFIGNKTGMYKLLISFPDGNEGCAVITMSVKTNQKDRSKKPIDHDYEIIYEGIENPVEIYTDANTDHQISHQITKGTLFKKNNEYVILVNDTGYVEIKSSITDPDGKLIEEAVSKFKVIPLPQPVVTFHNLRGGLINSDEIAQGGYLKVTGITEFDENNFLIIGFQVGKELNSIESYKSFNKDFTFQQNEFLKGLPVGEKFYIYDIKIKGPSDKIYKAEPLGFIIY